MSYVYGESNRAERTRLAGHLRDCPQCQTRVNRWQTAQSKLDGWQLQPGRRSTRKTDRSAFARPLLKWAAILAFFAGVGFATGRLSSPAVNSERARAAIESQVRQELRQEFAQMLRREVDKSASATLAASREQALGLLADYDDLRAEDNQAISTTLDRLESQQTADYVSLKKQLDTVAVLTDASLRSTENQVVQLAAGAGPNLTANPTKPNAN